MLPAQELNNVIEIAAEADTRAWLLTDIAWREERQMDDVDRVRFFRAILDRADGASLVVNALSMLAHVEAEAAFRDHWPKDLRVVGRDAIVATFQIDDLNDNTSHYLSSTLRAILRNSSAGEVAEITEALTLRAAKKYGSAFMTCGKPLPHWRTPIHMISSIGHFRKMKRNRRSGLGMALSQNRCQKFLPML